MTYTFYFLNPEICRVEPDIFVDIYLLFVDIITFRPECSRQDIHVPLLTSLSSFYDILLLSLFCTFTVYVQRRTFCSFSLSSVLSSHHLRPDINTAFEWRTTVSVSECLCVYCSESIDPSPSTRSHTKFLPQILLFEYCSNSMTSNFLFFISESFSLFI